MLHAVCLSVAAQYTQLGTSLTDATADDISLYPQVQYRSGIGGTYVEKPEHENIEDIWGKVFYNIHSYTSAYMMTTQLPPFLSCTTHSGIY